MSQDETKNDEMNKKEINKKMRKLVEIIEQNDKIMESKIVDGKLIEGGDVFSDIKNFFDSIGDALGQIPAFFNRIFSFINDVIEDIKQVGLRFEMIGLGMKDMLQGIFVESPKAIINGVTRGFIDIITLFRYLAEFLRTYIMCGVQYLTNLHKCILYYTLDSLGQIAYTLPRMILWFCAIFLKRDLYGTEKKIWDYIESIDSYIYGFVGFHIIHYPKNVRDLCYNCKRLKVAAMAQKSSDIKFDFANRIPELLKVGSDLLYQGKIEFDVAGEPSRGNFKDKYDKIKSDNWQDWE